MKIRGYFIFLGAAFFCSQASADSYIHPQAGAVVPMNGDKASYSLGVAVGYSWTKFFSTELSYARVIGSDSAADGDIIKGLGILQYPLQYFSPYVSGGAGVVHFTVPTSDEWNSMILLGTGVAIGPILFFSVNIGFDYAIVNNAPDYIQPAVGLGLSF